MKTLNQLLINGDWLDCGRIIEVGAHNQILKAQKEVFLL